MLTIAVSGVLILYLPLQRPKQGTHNISLASARFLATRIAHTRRKVNSETGQADLQGEAGFDFLGFNIRQYPVGRTHSGKVNGSLLGFKTLTKPSHERIQLHYQKLTEVIDALKPATQQELIKKLNSIIVGWGNNYSAAASKEIFSALDRLLYYKLKNWAKWRHPKKTQTWIARKYWLIDKGKGWTFGTKDGLTLAKHSNIAINRHTKIKGEASPFDGNWTYWSTRRGEYPGTPTRVAEALKWQKGKCFECGLHFAPDDLIEIHHLDGNHKNNRRENLGATHRHCHDRIHGGNGKLSTQLGTDGNSQFGEEPDELKSSRPVLVRFVVSESRQPVRK